MTLAKLIYPPIGDINEDTEIEIYHIHPENARDIVRTMNIEVHLDNPESERYLEQLYQQPEKYQLVMQKHPFIAYFEGHYGRLFMAYQGVAYAFYHHPELSDYLIEVEMEDII